MTKKQERRLASLLPGGIPKKLRIYDNGGKTLDCYSVIFTGTWKGKKQGWFFNISMNGCPNHPQMGIYIRDETNFQPDVPRYSHLGKKIRFQDLPEECKQAVLEDYKAVWQL